MKVFNVGQWVNVLVIEDKQDGYTGLGQSVTGPVGTRTHRKENRLVMM